MEDLNSSSTNDFDFDSANAEVSEGLFGPQEAAPADDDVNLDDPTPAAEGTPAAADPAAADPTEGTTDPATPASEAIPAPKTWRKEAAEKWATLPPEVQREVAKREDDIFKGLESYKADAHIGKSVKSIIEPYMPMLKAAGLDPLSQVDGLMKAHYLLATGTPEQKQMLFQRLAQDYNVQLDGEAPYVDPQVSALQKQLSDLQSKITGREAQEAEVTRTTLQREIDTFASDPAHPHFDEVANDIAMLLKSGGAKDLQEAYDKAVWLNPATRAKEQSRTQSEAAAKAKAEAEAKRQAAQRATGANVKSKAKAAGAAAPLGSIEDTLNAALGQIRSRA